MYHKIGPKWYGLILRSSLLYGFAIGSDELDLCDRSVIHYSTGLNICLHYPSLRYQFCDMFGLIFIHLFSKRDNFISREVLHDDSSYDSQRFTLQQAEVGKKFRSKSDINWIGCFFRKRKKPALDPVLPDKFRQKSSKLVHINRLMQFKNVVVFN